ncbi:Glutamate-1-semialdehyde 2,1-aminomutase [Chlamydia avium]|uniref:Aminotransferase class-III family protein n=1 Tax=Chlamydia avium TaxID=1457141 RepID=A0ABP2X5L7_9CHLA|nr:glutamate-1-semialdehyde 2,1-aminomutase [Chlamydia avium]EPP37341.1 aminotransferase class-III family protein [Chlamydia psittaci 10_743_SC13]EPP38070.1 aminotransferase class-III family protein [Chlamydia avium]VVT42874.1 Glutamate-1-semialdehyde 2,1-aminomutase [Chlamydia avium]
MPILDKMVMTYSEACKYFPGGVNSPVRACRVVGIEPPIVSKAYRDVFTDSQGKDYIDFCNSWGSLIHGHSHPQIIETISHYSSLGISYGLTSEHEIAFASTLLSVLGYEEHKVRFVSSGTEATMTAVRLACGITARSVIIKFSGCYHGHADVLLSGISINEENISSLISIIDTYRSSRHYLPLTLILPYNDLPLFHEVMNLIGDLVACVIFEPVCANMGVILPVPGFLEGILATCRRFSSLSIVDEVVTGFRLGLRGACEKFSLVPDITVYGKILGGGMAVASLVAHQQILDHLQPSGSVFQAGTLSGNPIAMAVGKASIGLCSVPGFYDALNTLALEFFSPIQAEILSRGFPVSLVYAGSMFTFFFSETPPNSFSEAQQSDISRFGKFYRQAFSRGVYLSPSPLEASFLSSIHSRENLAYTQNVLIDSLSDCF